MAHVLVVDDEPALCAVLTPLLRERGHTAQGALSGEAALVAVRERRPDLVLLDLRMDGMDGLETLDRLRRTAPSVPVVMSTAYGDIDSAVTAMKMGALDFLAKPFDNARLLDTIDRLLAISRGGLARPRPAAIGESVPFRDTMDLALKFAVPDINVLLCGETGTGKEIFARLIHAASKRGEGPFVPVDCSMLPSELVESELFGHEKGAFTGATVARIGRFEAANGGTLFLDEVGNLSLGFQAKLLRVLQERCFCRVGSSEPFRVDVRIVSATNVDLREAIQRGAFRRDLFYRLKEINIELPPLRERRGDVPLLAGHFARLAAGRLGRPVPTLCGAALEALDAWSWPGNVRELESAIKTAVVLAADVILPEHLPAEIRGSLPGGAGLAAREPGKQGEDHARMELQMELKIPPPGQEVNLKAFASEAAEQAERILLASMLQRERCAYVQLAKLLGVDPKTLRAKLRRYGLDRRAA